MLSSKVQHGLTGLAAALRSVLRKVRDYVRAVISLRSMSRVSTAQPS